MKRQISVFEWNVKGHSRYGNECPKEFYDVIENSCKPDLPDIIVLTEYKMEKNKDKSFEHRIMKNYHIEIDNDILIGINNKKWGECEKIICRGENYPEIVVVKTKKTKSIHYPELIIVGMRIRINSKKEDDKVTDYENRVIQLNSIKKLKMIKNVECPVIIAGDFNTGKYYGDMNNLALKDGKKGKKLNTIYNLQKVKASFYNLGFDYFNSTPFGDVNQVFSQQTGNSKNKYKLDHIFVKGAEVETVKYVDVKYFDDKNRELTNRRSDHKMLLAKIKV